MGISIASKLDSLTSSARYRSGSGGGTGGGEMEPTYLDMMLVLDSSGSIGSSEFREAKEATTVIELLTLISAFSPSHTSTR